MAKPTHSNTVGVRGSGGQEFAHGASKDVQRHAVFVNVVKNTQKRKRPKTKRDGQADRATGRPRPSFGMQATRVNMLSCVAVLSPEGRLTRSPLRKVLTERTHNHHKQVNPGTAEVFPWTDITLPPSMQHEL